MFIGDSLFKWNQVARVQADFHQNPFATALGAANAGISGRAGVKSGLCDGKSHQALAAFWATGAVDIAANDTDPR